MTKMEGRRSAFPKQPINTVIGANLMPSPRFTPNSGHSQRNTDVRFGPIATCRTSRTFSSPPGLMVLGRRVLQSQVGDAKPSRTIFPFARPLSISACARFKFCALMEPKLSASVVCKLPSSTSFDTLFSSSPCSAISGVSKTERVNMDSQCIDTLLRLNTAMSNIGGSSIRPKRPCGAISSATSLK